MSKGWGGLLRTLLWDDPFKPWFLLGLLLINGLGSVWGYFWYQDQLLSTPVWVWPFVPDSPLASSLFTLALAVLLGGRRPTWFLALANTAVIKYGVWAMVLIGDLWLSGGEVRLVEVMLWLSHLGMALEGLIFLRHLVPSPALVTGLGAWLLLNDAVDYFAGLHPYLFLPDQLNLAAATAIGMSGLLIVFMLGLPRHSLAKKPHAEPRILKLDREK